MSKPARQNWGSVENVLPEVDLIQVQTESYQDFLDNGVQEAFAEINENGGILDFTGKNWKLEFGNHFLGTPKLTPEEARRKGLTYDAPLRTEVKLTNLRTEETNVQEVFMADLPLMTETGTFVINGVDRCVVNQLVRSPGIFFSGESDPRTGRMLYRAELRPMRGSWLEVATSRRDILTVKIDRHRKVPATVLLRALGYASDEELLEMFKDVDINEDVHYIANTIEKDPTKSQNEALIELYEKIRPGEPAVLESAEELLKDLFFNPRRYDLSKVGRYKVNRRLDLNVPNTKENSVLTKEDIVAAFKYLIKLQNGVGKVDDIDHLSNRRVRRVGELVQTVAFRVGLLRLERSIREKMSLAKTTEELSPASLINARPLIATVSEFFRRNRLSAILDQTNPLSEVDNLRRLSVMGTGGVTRERASFSMRDINASQYSRIDPVRSPEGPNIGLVTYLALYARVNEYGFLEAPYRKVVEDNGKMKVTDEVVYLQADDEEDLYITHSSIEIDEKGYIAEEWIPMRHANEFIEGPAEQVQYIDVVPRQVVGTSASLIPFISHDEANRALMGSHMQCQAVPLIGAQAPVVGTGMERDIAKAMGHTIYAEYPGEVTYVDAQKIVLRLSKKDAELADKHIEERHSQNVSIMGQDLTYSLRTFVRTSQSTCYSQRAVVKVGQKIAKGDLLIDGPAAENGELALGQNLVIAYTSFDGLGYEDAIIISNRLVKDDLLSSVHISEYEAQVMDTKLGPEELTRDIPNVSEAELRHLDEAGIVAVGSQVQAGDILVGKIAPKGETELTAEERLLRAIFGEKAREVRDTSLRMPNGEAGTVIGVNILDRAKGDELETGVNMKVIVHVAQLRKIMIGDKVAGRHGNKGVISKIVPVEDMPHMADGTPVDIIISPLSVLARMNMGQLLEAHLGWAARELGYKVAVPVFEEFEEDKIWNELDRAGLPKSGKAQLYDGRTGEACGEETVVGIGYILKLVHMVEDKTHARSTGPYSLVTQQPLGGKAQMGGQRLGEMEVWALEAHQAAHTLQEMLTIKSDDVVGRSKAFEAIVSGKPIPEPAVPESFRVLVRELNSLGLQVEMREAQVTEEEEEAAPAVDDETIILDDEETGEDAPDTDDDSYEEDEEPEAFDEDEEAEDKE
ncbi:DNA-directed RNA polymerase subunit beta [Candidatus Woesebacteria bacterium]|nr:DNA-directed RNA polymerase subunit beta [Candidatus Woesebacteria bacterium]MCD8546496.1 DNA-directed RNA polymerase subunit beta [Candidatus Woesebacteria bacterium]